MLCQRFVRSRTLTLTALARHRLHTLTPSRLSQLGLTFNQKPSSSEQEATQKQLQPQHAKIKDSFNTLTKYSSPLAKFRSMVQTSTTKKRETSPSVNGLFGKKELVSVEGFRTLRHKAEASVNSLIAEALAPQPARKLVEIFDDISNELCCVADLAEFVRTSHPDAQYRQAANLAFGHISQLVERLNTNYELYCRLRHSLENEAEVRRAQLDDCDKRVCRLFLVDFEQSGIHLDKSCRDRFVAINDRLVSVLMKFQICSQAPTQIKGEHIEPKFREIAKIFKEPIQVDSMFIDSELELLREFVYKSYLRENADQEANFLSIISKRKQLAQLCGFETFSHRANLNTIMETPAKIMAFLRECSASVASKAEADFSLMREYKRSTLRSEQALMPWDVPLISGRLKKQLLDLDRLQYTSFFSLGCCMEGLNIVLNSLYKVNLEVARLEPGEAWHEDIYKLAVLDESKGLLGFIYCDFYHRTDKFSNVDCHFTIQCSKQLRDGSYQLPIVVLHLNFPPPTSDRPTLLTFEMMENLFHEFGHAMHSMFAKTRYQHVSGTRCSTDLAEVPSQLMEHYCREPRVLKLFARHFATGAPLDDRALHKLCASKRLFAACELQTQLVNSMLDQAFHDDDDVSTARRRPIDLVKDYTERHHALPFVAGAHWHLRFTHLVGYGAKYYSYLVSKAIASQIWAECFEREPLSASAGEAYRRRLLEHGGERRPNELLSSLVGFDGQNSSLVKSLTRHL